MPRPGLLVIQRTLRRVGRALALATEACKELCGCAGCATFYRADPCPLDDPQGPGVCPDNRAPIYVCTSARCRDGRPMPTAVVMHAGYCYAPVIDDHSPLPIGDIPAGSIILPGPLDCASGCDDDECGSPRLFREVLPCAGTTPAPGLRVFICANSVTEGCGILGLFGVCWIVNPAAALWDEDDLPEGAEIYSGGYFAGAKCCDCVPGCGTGRLEDYPCLPPSCRVYGPGHPPEGTPCMCCCPEFPAPLVWGVIRHRERIHSSQRGCIVPDIDISLISGSSTPDGYMVHRHFAAPCGGEPFDDDVFVAFVPQCAWFGIGHPNALPWQINVGFGTFRMPDCPALGTPIVPPDAPLPPPDCLGDPNGVNLLRSFSVTKTCERLSVHVVWEQWINDGNDNCVRNFIADFTWEAVIVVAAGGPCSGGCSSLRNRVVRLPPFPGGGGVDDLPNVPPLDIDDIRRFA